MNGKYKMAKNMRGGIRLAIEAAGGHRKLGRLLGVSHQSIAQWMGVPAERLLEVEVLTGVPREEMRPDLFRGFERKRKHKQRTNNAS